MKKNTIIISSAVIVVLIIIGIFLFFNNKTNTYDKTKEEDLKLWRYLDKLNECKNESIRNTNMFCPEKIPEQDVLDKLEAIKDLRGIPECSAEGYFICGNLTFEDCEEIISIGYTSSKYSEGTGSTYTSILIYNCKDGKQYLSESSTPAPRIKISRVQLTDEQISKLKSLG